jgi:(hydroxyamino)benzene mutase
VTDSGVDAGPGPALTPSAAAHAAAALRHPADPDPARASKATAVFVLGVVAALTGPFVGGAIPATIALLLAREVRADLLAADGYLVGTRRYERGVVLAWTGIVLALATIVVAVVRGLYLWALTGGADFDPTVQ